MTPMKRMKTRLRKKQPQPRFQSIEPFLFAFLGRVPVGAEETRLAPGRGGETDCEGILYAAGVTVVDKKPVNGNGLGVAG